MTTTNETNAMEESTISSRLCDVVSFRVVCPTDIPVCSKIESESYPHDEKASLSTLQYRQHHASKYFRCVVLPNEYINSCSTTTSDSFDYDNNVLRTNTHTNNSLEEHVTDDDNDTSSTHTVIGFICGTRCNEFTHESMYAQHVPDGSLLAIHSVVIDEKYRRCGIASRMLKNYMQWMIQQQNSKSTRTSSVNNHPRIEKLVLLSKSQLLSFYVNSGFKVMRPSLIVHGKEKWYELEYDMPPFPSPLSGITQNNIPCYIIDSFAVPNQIGTGNPAAVVVLDKKWYDTYAENEIDTAKSFQANDAESKVNQIPTGATEWMQTVANEFNLSETAFVWPCLENEIGMKDKDDNALCVKHFHIRYFTPTIEVSLCGHATLAAASVLYQTNLWNVATFVDQGNDIIFHTRVADVTLRVSLAMCDKLQNKYTRITMSFPCAPVEEIVDESDKRDVEQMLNKAIQIDPSTILYMGLANDLGDLFIEVTHDSFMNIQYSDDINFSCFNDWHGYSRGVIISCLGTNVRNVGDKTTEENTTDGATKIDETISFYSRFFGPKAGIDEDPVTGSAHCALAPYYEERCNNIHNGEITIMRGYQKSKRGGTVECSVSHDKKRVKITGTAVNTVTGTLWW